MTKEIAGNSPECLEQLTADVAKSINELLTNLADEATAGVCNEVMIGVVIALTKHQTQKGWPKNMSVDHAVECVKHSTDKAAYAVGRALS